ncbi:hypothetical protein A6P54_12120 [Bacillus sp. MKU004]|nr:hypothetical protein A6P54_12120 [Bacillus sp. MKU004]
MCLAQIGVFEPGSRGMGRFFIGAWHKRVVLFQAQNGLIVPGTIRGHCSWHNSPLLCLEQPRTTGFTVVYRVQDPVFEPGTFGGLCTWYMKQSVYQVQSKLPVPGTHKIHKKTASPKEGDHPN